jgi:hypothetical protein
MVRVAVSAVSGTKGLADIAVSQIFRMLHPDAYLGGTA